MVETINISKEIGKSSAVLHSDGLLVYEKMKALQTKEKSELLISFDGITHCTTSFLNASIGKFLIENPSTQLKFDGIAKETSLMEKIGLVMENALNAKKRNSLDDSTRNLFHA